MSLSLMGFLVHMALCAKVICKMASGDHLHAGDTSKLAYRHAMHYAAEVPDLET